MAVDLLQTGNEDHLDPDAPSPQKGSDHEDCEHHDSYPGAFSSPLGERK
jgi:hypothetical protein